jgi:hypothetical protein
MDFRDAPVYRRTVSRYARYVVATVLAGLLTVVLLAMTILINVAQRDATVFSAVPAVATCGALLLFATALERAWQAKD